MVLGLTFGIWGGLISVIALLLAILVIYDVWAKRKRMKQSTKIIWTVFAVFFSIITALVYWIVKNK